MPTTVVIGSGASGVHFAISLLRKGYDVVMLDVGRSKPPPALPGATLNELKRDLPDPAAYFLGPAFQAVVHPGSHTEYYTKYYGFPPSKSNVFSTPSGFACDSKGFEPLFSFAQGGLAEAWTAGVYPLNDHELVEFPFSYDDIAPHYGEVARRIGISGAEDDLARFYPHHDNLRKPLDLDPHSEHLVERYERRGRRSAGRLRCFLGHSRVATLSSDTSERKGCTYCGRCLWGCPIEALYTPSITLRECLRHPRFHYVSDVFASHFRYDDRRRVTAIVARSLSDGSPREIECDRIVLAAGTLSSSKIFLESIFRATGEIVKLPGLMDNRQILIPFVTPRLIGRPYAERSYQYHELAIGIEGERPEEYVHGQITALKSALAHPIIQSLPFDLRTSTFLFRNVRASLGVVNLSLHDRRRETSYVTLVPGNGEGPKLSIRYTPAIGENEVIRRAVGRTTSFLWKLGCLVPPWMVHVRPMGASVHYTGTLPMSAAPAPLTVSRDCRSHDFENLYVVDGTSFPFLPAKNVTFSLMANAVRVAESAF